MQDGQSRSIPGKATDVIAGRTDPEDQMTYQYPYLDPHQTRTQEPTAWQHELANAIESIFAKGAHELDELIAGLNASRVRPPDGAKWTEQNLTSVMRELGA
jgi:Recombinase-like helix-turn-helix domain